MTHLLLSDWAVKVLGGTDAVHGSVSETDKNGSAVKVGHHVIMYGYKL